MMTLKLDTRSLQNTVKKLKNVSQGTKDFKPFLSELSQKMTDNVNKNFDTEGSHLGSKWAALKSNTVMQRVRLGYGTGPILQRTGKLKKSTYEKEKTNKKVVVSNSASYYPYHQLGTRKMKQRTIMQWNNKTKKEAERMFRDYINKIIRNG